MKKFLSLLFVVIVLTLALTLSACTGDNSQSTKKQDPPAHEHVIVIDEAIEATCFSTGLTKGKHCSVCNRIFLAQRVINRISHTEVIDEAVPATCTTTGLTKGKHCSVCSKVLVAQEIIPAYSHTEVIDEAVPATCTTTGLTKGKHCSVCSKVLVAQEIIPAYNHSFGVWNNISSPNDNINITEQRSCSCGFTETRTYPIEGSKGLEYQINSDGKSCTVIGIGSCLDSGIAIPNTVDGYTVTSIGEEAFSGQSDITFIIIPNTVTSIGTKAFYGCVGLKDMTIPASVTSIGTQIFQKASNIEVVYYYSTYSSSDNPFLNINKIIFGGTKVPDYICEGLTNVREIEILDTVESIGFHSFADCIELTSVIINEGVLKIDYGAFSGCIKLTDVTIPKSVEDIGYFAFAWCENLMNIEISKGVKNIGWCTFYGCKKLTYFTIPSGVTVIKTQAFDNCCEMTSIVIPNSVVKIDSSAFDRCDKLSIVFYQGDALEWEDIIIEDGNEILDISKIYFYTNTIPTDSGQYWHYVDGIPTIWK